MLIASLDSLLRVASNPFFPYMLAHIETDIEGPVSAQGAVAAVPHVLRDTPVVRWWSFDALQAGLSDLVFGYDQADDLPP